MQGPSHDKKWFVYLGDHHEGPFTQIEIQEQLAGSKITKEHFVWQEGMADWKALQEVEELLAPPQEPAPSLPHERTAPPFIMEEVPLESSEPSVNVNLEDVAYGGDLPVLEEPSIVATMEAPLIQNNEDPVVDHSKVIAVETPINFEENPAIRAARKNRVEVTGSQAIPRRKSYLRIALVLAVLGGMGVYVGAQINVLGVDGFKARIVAETRAVIAQLVVYVPQLGKFAWSIPKTEHLSDEDFERLNQTAGLSLATDGPKVAIAVEKGAPRTPRLVVASNLPDGVKITVFVKGVSQTLLNDLHFQKAVEVTLHSHLGISQEIRAENGQALPQGQYAIYAFDSLIQTDTGTEALKSLPVASQQLPDDLPQGRKVVGIQAGFLGGTKDKEYLLRLKKYHETVLLSLKKEVETLKQFQSTLTNQFQSTLFQFQNLSRMKSYSATSLNKWKSFSKKWYTFVSHLRKGFDAWTPDYLARKVYFADLHKGVRSYADLVLAFHLEQGKWLAEKNMATRTELMKKLMDQDKVIRDYYKRLQAKESEVEKALSEERLPPKE